MKRKITTITEEYDENGKIKTRIEETTEEEDTGYIYPQYPTYPWISPITWGTGTGSPPLYIKK